MEEVSSSLIERSSNPSSKEQEPTLGTQTKTTKNGNSKTSNVANDGQVVELVGVNVRKLTSMVWKHFEQLIVDDEIKAKCMGCNKVFVGGGKNGTSHLKDHIRRCMKTKQTMDVKQQLLQASASRSGSTTLGMGGKFKFNAQVARSELVNMIVLHEYPLAIVDHIGFKRYSRSLNPDFKVISRNTVKADVLREFKEEKSRLMKLLAENESRVAITTDMWTSNNQRKGATEAFSGRKYPTANLYFQKVSEIRLAFRRWFSCGNKVIETMASKMIDKFDKYWNVMLSAASVLDPRRKLECVSFYYKLVYDDDVVFECGRVKRLLVDLVHDYEKDTCHDETSFVTPSSSLNVNNKRPMVDLDEVDGLWEKHVLEQPPKKSRKCEVETYLEEQRIVVDQSKFNLLAWCNAQSLAFPTLSKIARDILAVPISTVACESSFSTSGRIIGPHRSRLLPETIEALMCLQSWRRLHYKDVTKGSLECAPIYDDEDVEAMEK
ncbi:hypothetical protein BVRB_4g088070 isoform A [Beta vulgaris subsp. vulgaris]|nr:hypothetical protein BVRB_4g088070 isoform A [Beta vulgaris subsp. vulgaris]